jgi:hypothetical protein
MSAAAIALSAEGYPFEWFSLGAALEDDDTLVCSICQLVKRDACMLATNLDPDDAESYPCGHSFCRLCIETWLSRRHTCPSCRRPSELAHLLPDMTTLQKIWCGETRIDLQYLIKIVRMNSLFCAMPRYL